MLWNKNTIFASEIDSVIETLKELNEPYDLSIMARVQGNGLNDDTDELYPIRRLAYRDIVLLEQMERHPDCDADDYIISHRFKKSNDWYSFLWASVPLQMPLLLWKI